MVCGESAELSLILIAAMNAPVVVGAKCPWIVQVAPAAKLVPQLLAKTNEDTSVPVTVMLVIDKATLPMLVMVTESDVLEVPTFVAGNERLVADSVTGDTPVPLNVIVCGEVPALSVRMIAAVNAPVTVGAKCP